MAAIMPLSEDRVTPELQQLYSELRDNFGTVPNFFALMARRPRALKAILSPAGDRHRVRLLT